MTPIMTTVYEDYNPMGQIYGDYKAPITPTNIVNVVKMVMKIMVLKLIMMMKIMVLKMIMVVKMMQQQH